MQYAHQSSNEAGTDDYWHFDQKLSYSNHPTEDHYYSGSAKKNQVNHLLPNQKVRTIHSELTSRNNYC